VDFPAPRPEWRVRQAVDRHGRWTIEVPAEQNVLGG
jgi:hypothetical protein